MTEPPAPIRVFILDDHELVRRGPAEVCRSSTPPKQVLDRVRSGPKEPSELKLLTDQERRILSSSPKG
jgi:hypothetical protein